MTLHIIVQFVQLQKYKVTKYTFVDTAPQLNPKVLCQRPHLTDCIRRQHCDATVMSENTIYTLNRLVHVLVGDVQVRQVTVFMYCKRVNFTCKASAGSLKYNRSSLTLSKLTNSCACQPTKGFCLQIISSKEETMLNNLTGSHNRAE